MTMFKQVNAIALGCVSGILLMIAWPAVADRYYVYSDQTGRTIIADRLPSDRSAGYKIVNKNGVTLKVVPPAVQAQQTPAKRKKALKTENLRDKALLGSYFQIDDIEQAKAQNLNSIDAQIGMAVLNASNIQRQISAHKPGALKDDEAAQEQALMQESLQAAQEYINALKKQRVLVAHQFDQDIERFKELQFGLR